MASNTANGPNGTTRGFALLPALLNSEKKPARGLFGMIAASKRKSASTLKIKKTANASSLTGQEPEAVQGNWWMVLKMGDGPSITNMEKLLKKVYSGIIKRTASGFYMTKMDVSNGKVTIKMIYRTANGPFGTNKAFAGWKSIIKMGNATASLSNGTMKVIWSNEKSTAKANFQNCWALFNLPQAAGGSFEKRPPDPAKLLVMKRVVKRLMCFFAFGLWISMPDF